MWSIVQCLFQVEGNGVMCLITCHGHLHCQRYPPLLQASVQFSCSVVVRLFVTPWTTACQASLFITNSQSLLKLMSIKSVMPSNISSSVVPFSSHLQSFPASGSFPRSQFFASGGQNIGALCYKVLCYKHKRTYNFILNQQPIKKCIPLCKATRLMTPFPFTWNKPWTMSHT